ncbi:5'-nucleotidase C-terminal domain-containing protein [Geodermatophilus sp. DSM 45219]|uniref:5'-nucleotidase C-terminal domain-containing protein n=1 Tax=Geodermatophilus sp. DSM 45219 TaxID=1881103 RepID=UPI00087EC53E|nr:5'-nucleotidase C-terminal domain-containing protein [Geodermatophilus sp. DSM 45219]SDO14960.1 5'-nucleotidase, C-terminal domain [Geodermatophilus sp. DSM 45219]
MLSIAAPFSREAVFPQGEVTIRDIAGLYVFDNTLEAVELTGAELRAYLEESASYSSQVPATGEVTPAALAPTKPDYDYDTLSGVVYDLDVSSPEGERVTRLEVPDGTVVQDADRFVVAVNDYRRGGGFPHVSGAEVVHDEQAEIRHLLIDRAQDRQVIDPAGSAVDNWQLVRAGEPLFP